MRPLHTLALSCLGLGLLSGFTAAAQSTARPLIVEKINENQLVTVKGNTPPAANAKNDLGRVSPNLKMTDLILVLRRSPEQQAAFDAFVASQYDPSSPNFHHWLQPDEVGTKFGPALADIGTISNWLASHGLSVDGVSKDRMTIRFSGTAAQVESAFHTEIHNLTVKGEPHISNMTDPQIPMALDPVVLGPKALSNFIPRPLHRLGGKARLNSETGRWQQIAGTSPFHLPKLDVNAVPQPEMGFSCGTQCQIEDVTPYDFATIYNVLPLWNASTAIDGTGQTIAVAGTSDVRTSDVASFRSAFGLPAGPTLQTIVANGSDPGYCGSKTNATCTTLNDQIENALDVEWSGALAPNAQVVLVVSGETSPTTDTVGTSAQYVIDHKTAPVLNVSYGLCELFMGTGGNASYNTMWQSAAAEGIAVFVAAGDAGSAGCDQGGDASGTPYAAQFGLAVSGLSSTPYDTAVGGTDLNWGATASPYWNSTNSNSNGSSAKGYMPEVPWNSSCTNPLALSYLQSWASALQKAGYSASNPTDAESACNFVDNWYSVIYQGTGTDISWLLDTAGAGGGVSNCTTNSTNNSTVTPDPTSCSGGYSKPSWQTGVTGIPADGKRDVPDVSFFASSSFLGSAYLICVSDWSAPATCITTSTTTQPTAGEVGGTSAATPAMAGVMALINQKAGSPQGSPNAQLYQIAAKQTYSSCSSETGTASSSCYFNDIDAGTSGTSTKWAGTIEMACASGSANCTVNHTGDTIGVLSGYDGAVGYDLATGLGSLNVANVVNAWTATIGTATATVTVTPANNSIAANKSLNVTIALTGASGTPTGSVVLSGGGYTSSPQTLSSGSATLTIPANSLAAGTDTLTANYGGDATYAAASGTANVTVTAAPAPTVTVTPTSNSIVVTQSLNVTVATSGTSGTPTGTVTLSSGSYTSAATTLTTGSATITIPANSLTVGTDTLTASYSGDSTYGIASGTASETVTAPPKPTVTVSATPSTFNSGQGTVVSVTVAGASGTPTGSVALTSGSFTSASHTLDNTGATTFNISPDVLAVGTDTITANYGGDATYGTATGTTSVTITQSTYTLAATTPAAINRGSSAASTITWTTTSNFSANVTLSSCTLNSGGPSNSSADTPTCSVSSSAFGQSGSGTATVTTKAATSASLKRPAFPGKGLALGGSGAVLALMMFFGIPARRRGWRAMLGMIVLMLAFGSLSACGGGGGSNGGGGGGSSDPGTASGQYTFTVKSTGADLAKTAGSVTFTVTVN